MSAFPRPLASSSSQRGPARQRVLTDHDRTVVRAIAEAMFSQDGEVPPETLESHLDEVDALIACASKPVRLGLRVALTLVRLSPILLFFRLRLLDQLRIDDRVALLSRLERSRFAVSLSLAFVGWRSVMTLVFYESQAELLRLGYSKERKVYKRHLALAGDSAVPLPVESGVRLRDVDSERSSPESSAARLPTGDASRDVA